jgi:hypothetical protein
MTCKVLVRHQLIHLFFTFNYTAVHNLLLSTNSTTSFKIQSSLSTAAWPHMSNQNQVPTASRDDMITIRSIAALKVLSRGEFYQHQFNNMGILCSEVDTALEELSAKEIFWWGDIEKGFSTMKRFIIRTTSDLVVKD